MQSIKDLVGIFDERIKSPIYSYVIIAFLLINWQPVLFLFFSDLSFNSRIAYFNIKTDWWSLIFWPLVVGIVGAMTSPWISYLGSWWAERPIKHKKLRQVRVAVEVRKARADFENAVNEQVDAAIKTALQDQAIQQIDDTELRERITKEVANLRAEFQSQLDGFGETKDIDQKKLQSRTDRDAERLEALRALRQHYVDTEDRGKIADTDRQIEIVLRNAAKV